jgi:hypothetical protein
MASLAAPAVVIVSLSNAFIASKFRPSHTASIRKGIDLLSALPGSRRGPVAGETPGARTCGILTAHNIITDRRLQ